MSRYAIRNILMLVAFAGLVVGAYLRLKGYPYGWPVLIASIILYIVPRFLIRR